MVGTTLTHYRILHRVAAGGMGVIYCARDERLEREVALKVLPEGALADAPARARFRNEALALSRLNHPAIATIFDFDSEGGTDFLVMEYVQGTTLAEKIAGGAVPEPEAIDLGIQIAEALEAAHEQGVVHRDLKPGNIVVTPRGRVKVLRNAPGEVLISLVFALIGSVYVARMLARPKFVPKIEQADKTQAAA